MSLSEMKEYIYTCKKVFPSIDVVVFTGGECTLLHEDLLAAIRFSSQMKLITRIVTNGHWGKNQESTGKIIKRFTEAGLSEINLSTGKDHLSYIPLHNIINIVKESTKNKFISSIVISVEKRDDYKGNSPIYILKNEIEKLENKNKVFIIESPWVNFRKRNELLNKNKKITESGGCKNLFSGIQINPNGQLLSCCGLACEYSPLLKLGQFSENKISQLYNSQFNDLLKLWLYTDGPLNILNRLNNRFTTDLRHDCDYCLELLSQKENINKLLDISQSMAKEILLKYIINRKTSKCYEKE